MNRKTRVSINKSTLENVLRMKNENISYQVIAASLNLSLGSIYALLQRYEQHLNDGGSIVDFFKKSGPKVSTSTIIQSKILNSIIDDCSRTQKGIADQLIQSGTPVSQATICKNLKKIGMTRKKLKKIKDVNNPIQMMQRQQYAAEVSLIDDNNIFFIDETGFNLYTSFSHGYSPKKLEAMITVPKSKGRNISLLAVISKRKIECFKIEEGAFNSDKYLDFLVQLVSNNILPKNCYLIADNVPFHKSTNVVNFLRKENINYKFLPPYSPALNPIEEVFSLIKSRYSNLRPLSKTSGDIKNKIVRVINDILEDRNIEMCNYYRRMREFLEKSINNEFF